MSAFLSCMLAAAVLSPAPAAPIQQSGSQPVPDAVTKHTIQLPTGPLSYTAHASMIGLGPEGAPDCHMFYVAYTKDGADLGSRPVTFAFNGGPGSSTMWLHMGSLGPKRAPMNDDGSLPKPPYQAVDNQETWLDFTDVVLIDAPGTGYSRLANSAAGPRYFGVSQDIQAFTNFIRLWLTKHQRWNSPLFVAGESYGGIRGSGLSASLLRAGIAIHGFISISGTSSYHTLRGMRGNDVTYIGFLPSLAATAWYHKRLDRRFTSVEQVAKEAVAFVDNEYAAALQRGDSLTDAEKDRIAGKMSQLLGLSKEYILAANLRVSEFSFFRELLRDQRLTVGRLDSRITGKEELGVGDRGSGDPSDGAITPPYTAAINDYLTRDLQIKAPYPYLNYGSVRPWEEPEGSYAETASELRFVLARNPHFRVLYACGYYDLACPFHATMYTLNHMGLDKESRSRVSFTYYPAGHMMYTEVSSRIKFHADVREFVKACLAN